MKMGPLYIRIFITYATGTNREFQSGPKFSEVGLGKLGGVGSIFQKPVNLFTSTTHMDTKRSLSVEVSR